MKLRREEKIREVLFALSKSEIKLGMLEDSLDLVNDLGFDSILIVQMVVELEEVFDIEFEDDELDMKILSNYGNIKKIVFEKQKI
ncbi:MAG: phosphopantetheine-binding protein [Lachnospiraceae bacterium]|nr:phosphopantetheine-binding protein [Lachnospiraceae bacterium]